MKSDIRRQGILKCLSEADGPVTASYLSNEFGVSRQIIVKDIAKLKEQNPITSHSRGYLLNKAPVYKRVFKTAHSDDTVEAELNLIVDLGGTVEDVFVFHKFYNKLSAKLDIKSRLDIKNFIESIKSGKSSLLKNVTSGYHYHTISARDEKTLDLIEDMLQKEGFLTALQDYEPIEDVHGSKM